VDAEAYLIIHPAIPTHIWSSIQLFLHIYDHPSSYSYAYL